MSKFRRGSQSLRTGITKKQSQHGPVVIYNDLGRAATYTVEQIEAHRAATAKIASMSPEEKAALLKQLEEA